MNPVIDFSVSIIFRFHYKTVQVGQRALKGLQTTVTDKITKLGVIEALT